LQADVGWVEQELNEVRGNCRVFKAERDKACADLLQLQAELARTREELEEVKAENETTKRQYLDLLDTSANRVKELQAQQSLLQQRLDAAEQNPDSALDSIDPYIFLDWLKGLIKGKSKKPPQWEPTKADAEAILARARQS
jgi:multidrug resistance efflux pump